MKHAIPTDALGPFGQPISEAVHACVHCGYCLPTCPTYQVLGQEMDSPRGRIVLMKQVLEGALPAATAQPHIDACLGCLACETACPSGVVYRDLISPYRALNEPKRTRPWLDEVKRFALLHTLPHPSRFRLAARLGRFAAPFARFLPATLRPMLELMPRSLPAPVPFNEIYRPAGPARARVALHLGCVQQALEPEINSATLSLLLRHGVEVVVPPRQGCCGALGWHIGAAGDAREQAALNLAAIPYNEVDAVISNAAGCGSGLREYPLILRGTPWESQAAAFAAKVRDIAEFLVTLGPLEPPPPPPRPLTIAYQDACHLAHGQNVRSAPRHLLSLIPDSRLVELPDPAICCGSAGTYNIDHPATAAELGRRKAAAIADTGADFAASGNIGCLTQLRLHLPNHFPPHRLLHTTVLLDRAWRGTLAGQAPHHP
jgi:glycolate oxidase iron-sulfur subunit